MTDSLKEKFDSLPVTSMTDNAVWYRLKSGPVFEAARQVMEHHKEMDAEQKQQLGTILGQASGVLRHDRMYGAAIIYPEYFADPYGGQDLYVLSPAGLDSRTHELTHFQPEGGEQMTEAEIEKLETALFAPHGGSIPVISRPPLTRDTVRNVTQQRNDP